MHLSAPSIYAHACEALELRRGLSFLNVGSGTGFMSTVVAELIGPCAVHHGIELQPRLVESPPEDPALNETSAFAAFTSEVDKSPLLRQYGAAKAAKQSTRTKEEKMSVAERKLRKCRTHRLKVACALENKMKAKT